MKNIILSAFMCFAFLGTTYACSCAGESTVKNGVNNADLVAVGTIISKETVAVADSETIKLMKPDSAQLENYPYVHWIAKYRIVISEVFKGKITSDTISIYTGLGGGDCGNRLNPGEQYIIYGNEKTYFGTANGYPHGKNIFWTNICTRTQVANDAEINEIKAVTKKK